MAGTTTIGRYEIVEELGRGAMGSVFKALDPAVGRTVALKTVHSAALSGEHAEEYRARFYREAKASGVLAHPGIVPVFDVGEHDGAPFLVMEFVSGRTLDSAMKKGERFSLDRVCEIGQQIAEALGYAHRQGVIHRDIKPANVLMTSREVYGSERPRITDFGIAKLAQSELTSTGQLLGTPAFMPPEQFTGAPIDGRADLFSLGVILYLLATGEQPFPGETMTAVSYKVVYTEPIPPAKLNPSIPVGLQAVVLKCLAKSPADRYQSGEELALDLSALRANPNATALLATASPPPAALDPNATLAVAPSSISHPPPQAPGTQAPAAAKAKKPSKALKREVLVAAALLVVAAAAAGGWFFYAHRNPPPPPQQQTITTPTQQTAPAEQSQVVQGTVAPANEPAKPASAKPATSAPKPPAVVASKSATPAASSTPSLAAKPSPASAQQQSAAVAPAAKPPAPPAKPAVAAATSADPHTLDPNANSRFKIELSHLPNGLPITVEMNKAVYLHFVTGDKTSLDTLYVPPGIQTFRVTTQSGSQQVASNIVSSEFKAKKKKNLKIELRNQGSVPAGSSAQLSPSAQIYISLSSPLL
jgi:predicted Ser/Thr protein kinase